MYSPSFASLFLLGNVETSEKVHKWKPKDGDHWASLPESP